VKTLRFVVRHSAARRLTATVGLLCTLPLACVSILPALLLGPLVRLRPAVRARPARFASFAITYIGAELSGLIWLHVIPPHIRTSTTPCCAACSTGSSTPPDAVSPCTSHRPWTARACPAAR
jgi:hypothetical protein